MFPHGWRWSCNSARALSDPTTTEMHRAFHEMVPPPFGSAVALMIVFIVIFKVSFGMLPTLFLARCQWELCNMVMWLFGDATTPASFSVSMLEFQSTQDTTATSPPAPQQSNPPTQWRWQRSTHLIAPLVLLPRTKRFPCHQQKRIEPEP